MTLAHLFQPMQIGVMPVKNRIMMAPMAAPPVDEEGYVTPALMAYFTERARGGPAMITIGASAVEPSGLPLRGLVVLWDDKFVPGLQKMVSAVHEHDVKFGIELVHAGVQSATAQETKGPSAVPALALAKGVPKEMTREEIKECVKAFGRAAERCTRAGFDYLEIHAGHGYLINQFLSPYFNKRNDEYGGSFDNRIRLLLEIIHECKNEVGREIPIGVRINGEDFIKRGQGWNLADACKLAPLLEAEGISYISVSFGVYGSIRHTVPSMYEKQGAFVYLAEEVKKYVSVPVAAVCRIKDPIMADRIIKEGRADFILMGRALIADPELPVKARRGEIADIRPCIADCLGCGEHAVRQTNMAESPVGITCTVNPRVGREWVLTERSAGRKRVLVAGAGPGGLEVARQASSRGHEVTICEHKGYIGGLLRLAARIPDRQEIGDVIPWYERQLNKLGVEIRLNAAVTEGVIKQTKPDVVVVATGSVTEIPLGYVVGLDNTEELQLLTADELLEGQTPTGDNVLVIGIGHIGLQVADYLAEQGKNVYAIGNALHFGEKMAGADNFYLMGRLTEKGVKRSKKACRVEIMPTDEVWVIYDETKEKLQQIHTIVFAGRRLPDKSVAEISVRAGIETYTIGDAAGTMEMDQGTVLAAIATGYEVGRRL